jgi:hypothetical protein
MVIFSIFIETVIMSWWIFIGFVCIINLKLFFKGEYLLSIDGVCGGMIINKFRFTVIMMMIFRDGNNLIIYSCKLIE